MKMNLDASHKKALLVFVFGLVEVVVTTFFNLAPPYGQETGMALMGAAVTYIFAHEAQLLDAVAPTDTQTPPQK